MTQMPKGAWELTCGDVGLGVRPESSSQYPPLTTFAEQVRDKTSAIADLLIEKNAAYGNSALEPVRLFSRASAEEQLLVRIDDKLSRLQRGSEYADEDTVTDLIGYLILLQIAREDGRA